VGNGKTAVLRAISRRVYTNFLMSDRFAEYRDLLIRAQHRGYRLVSLQAFHHAVRAESSSPGRWLILRHDVDSDPRGAQRFFEVERSLGVFGSYYFRLATADV